MSVYKHKNSPYYHFEFQIKGRRFHGTTKQTNRRAAETVEKGERARAHDLLRQEDAGGSGLTLNVAAGRYWSEVGKDHADSAGTWRDIERLVGHLGADKLLVDITDLDVTELIAWRRGHRRWGRQVDATGKEEALVSNATVNRSTTQVLQKLFTRAKRHWGVKFEREPDWRAHRLKEPDEIIRELHEDESAKIDAAMRADFEPFFAFAQASGLRQRECLLRWSDVYWDSGTIIKRGKGGRLVRIPITSTIRGILWPLRGHHPQWVFTYVAQRTRDGRVKGQRYPITVSGLKTRWRRTRKSAAVEGFRFHDFRHDFATKLLRITKNLKVVQRALNHADIKTTSRYAHVQTEDIEAGMEQVQQSRNKSRTHRKKAS